MKSPHLTRYELELLNVLWKKGEGTVQEVCDELQRPLAYTTVMTTLRLLHSKKKVLKRIKRGRAHVYQPTVSRDEVSRSVICDFQEISQMLKMRALQWYHVTRHNVSQDQDVPVGREPHYRIHL